MGRWRSSGDRLISAPPHGGSAARPDARDHPNGGGSVTTWSDERPRLLGYVPCMGQSWRSGVNGGRTLVDVVIAALVAGLSVLDLVSSSDQPLPGERPADWLAYVLVIVASLALIWRRRAPLVV